jgi:hypothetical protein
MLLAGGQYSPKAAKPSVNGRKQEKRHNRMIRLTQASAQRHERQSYPRPGLKTQTYSSTG